MGQTVVASGTADWGHVLRMLRVVQILLRYLEEWHEVKGAKLRAILSLLKKALTHEVP